MECLFQVTQWITPEEYRLCCWVYRRRSVWGWIGFLLPELICLSGAVYTALAWRIFSMLLCLGMMVFYFLALRRNINRNINAQLKDIPDGAFHYDFSPTALTLITSRGEQRMEYTRMEGMIETNSHLYLLTPHGVIYLRKELLPPGLEEFLRGLGLKKR